MTRREVWAWTTLLGVLSQGVMGWLLLSIDLTDLRPGYIEELRLGVYVGCTVIFVGIVGWAREASKPRSR